MTAAPNDNRPVPTHPLGRGTQAWLAAMVVLIAWLAAFHLDKRNMNIALHIDEEWFRRDLIEGNLAHWLALAPTDSGFLRATADRQWRPAARQTATLVSQSRLLFVLSAGWQVTGEDAYLDAVRAGARFLIENFRDDDHGGWFSSVSPAGKVLDDSKDAYGHAFVIFGLSHACRVTGDPRFGELALETWQTVKDCLGDAHGGLYRRASRDWKGRSGNSQNPIMHMFEALLALHDATGSAAVFDDALRLGEFVFTRLYQADGGYLPENYDPQWRPRRDGYIDLGHQFEWAFLLARAVEKGFPRRYLAIARRLLDYGMAHGYDAEAGGIFSAASYDGRARGSGKGWWQQTEHLRALMRHAADLGRDDLWEAFDKSLAFCRAHFIDAQYGGWYGSHDPRRRRTDRRAAKANPWKVGYHTVGMYLEALRLAESAR